MSTSWRFECISSMVKSIRASDLSAVQRLSTFGGSVIRGFTVLR